MAMKCWIIAGSVKNWHRTVIDLPAGRWRQEFHGRVCDGGTCRYGRGIVPCPLGLLSKAEQDLHR